MDVSESMTRCPRRQAMRFIDYGLGVFRAQALDLVQPNKPYDLAALYETLLKLGELDAFEVHERFYEIGSLSGLEELRQRGFARPIRIEKSRE